MATININTDAMVVMTAKLESVGKNALPNAVRGTLNSLAFDVKKRTLPKSAKDTFETRQKTFIKAFSRVNVAKGNDMDSMQSEVGFFDRGAKSKQAVQDMEQQEQGGQIKARSFIPLDPARTGKSKSRMIAARNRLSKLSFASISVDAQKVNAPTRKQRFIRAAFKAKNLFGEDAYVLGNRYKGRQTLSRIDSITRNNGKVNIKRTALYTYQKGRVARVKATKFAQRAAYETGLNVDAIWMREGYRQIQKNFK
jgi:hypothetical protein